MKFFLTSAGLRNKQLADSLLQLLGKPTNTLSAIFVPTAAFAPVLDSDFDTETADTSWLDADMERIKALGFKSFEVIDIASHKISEEVMRQKFTDADLLVFGGGSEHYLAKKLNDTGLAEVIKNAAHQQDQHGGQQSQREKTFMGISAGSMIAGKFLPSEHVVELYPEEDFQRLPEKPLELLDLVFVPHLNSNFFQHVRKEKLDEMKNRGSFLHPTYSTDDETALAMVDGKIEVVGSGEVWKHLVS